ncbi:MAG TPA: helix-turn-helix domain-containing protein [Acidimicrobiales bacterium]|nr:helix-turn-helix domain-containing protein [Acidimicrobiales bacterium]
MPRSPEPTRTRLLDAALRLWAVNSIAATSLREIRLEAGQRNGAALQYHFGDKEGVLRALLQREIPWLERRRAGLLAGVSDLRSAAAVFVLPFAELATGTTHERFVVQFLSQLHDDVSRSLADVVELIGHSNSAEAADAVREWAGLDEDLLAERITVGLSSFLHACAMRAKAEQRYRGLPADRFRENIVDMFVGSLVGKC